MAQTLIRDVMRILARDLSMQVGNAVHDRHLLFLLA
jgi:hypothetical protein